MSRSDLIQRNRFAVIGLLMTIISLLFLFYVGNTLINSTKNYRTQSKVRVPVEEIACRN